MQEEFEVHVCARVCRHGLCPFRTEARGVRSKGLPGPLHAVCTQYVTCSRFLRFQRTVGW